MTNSAETMRRRQVARLTTLAKAHDRDDLALTTAAERFDMMWQVTLDAWTFLGEPVVEPRLPRHVERIVRRGG